MAGCCDWVVAAAVRHHGRVVLAYLRRGLGWSWTDRAAAAVQSHETAAAVDRHHGPEEEGHWRDWGVAADQHCYQPGWVAQTVTAAVGRGRRC